MAKHLNSVQLDLRLESTKYVRKPLSFSLRSFSNIVSSYLLVLHLRFRYLAAMDVHDMVEYAHGREFEPYTDDDLCGKTIDFTNQQEVAEAYAAYFQVNIHLYSFLAGGVRVRTIPSPVDLGRHIHMLIEEEHCYAITHVRHFLQRKKSDLCIHHLCDRCGCKYFVLTFSRSYLTRCSLCSQMYLQPITLWSRCKSIFATAMRTT